MPDFPIEIRSTEYQTEHGLMIRVKRGTLLCEFPGVPFLCDALLDSAAPFSIVPYTLSHYLTWTPFATRVVKAEEAGPVTLTWQGIACDLGTIAFQCVHLEKGIRSVTLRTLAKFPRQVGAPALERTVVLGLSFIEDNPVRVVLDGTAGTLCGYLSVL